MVARFVDVMNHIFPGDGNIWVWASGHALPYINYVQSECMMSGYALLTLCLSGISSMYHQFVDQFCMFGKSVYLLVVDECCHLYKT